MIRVTVELLPQGDESRKEVIGTGIVHQMDRKEQDLSGEFRRYAGWFEWKGVRQKVMYVAHDRSKNVWDLLSNALQMRIFGDERIQGDQVGRND